MYKISVIIPIYQVQAYIEECLESIFHQIRPEVEIIFVNDGSTDQSMDITLSYINKLDKKVKEQVVIINQSNKGLSVARNSGIEASSAEYISFIDSDDRIMNDYFNILLRSIENNEYDIIDFDLVTSEDKIINIRSSSESFDSVFEQMKWFSPARIYRKELFNSLRFTPNIYFEDIDLTPRLYLKAKKTKYINKPLYWYRSNPESITRKKSSTSNLKILHSLEIVIANYMQLYDRDPNPYYTSILLYCFYLLSVSACIRLGRKQSLEYVNKYKEYFRILSNQLEPLKLNIKVANFTKHPKIYIIFYSLYIKAKTNIH